MDWTPNEDFHNESLWPPREHPLYSLFHDARLGLCNGKWNYQKAIEYAELVRSAPPATDAQELVRKFNAWDGPHKRSGA